MSKKITYRGRMYRQVKGRCSQCDIDHNDTNCYAFEVDNVGCGLGGRCLRETFGSRFRHFFAARPEIVDMPGEAPPVVVYPTRKRPAPIPAANREGSAFHSDVDDNGGEL
jgi:hypothetical protein